MSKQKASEFCMLLALHGLSLYLIGDDLGNVFWRGAKAVESLPLTLDVIHLLTPADDKVRVWPPVWFTTEQLLSGNLPKDLRDYDEVELRRWRWPEYNIDVRLGYSKRYRKWFVASGRIGEWEGGDNGKDTPADGEVEGDYRGAE